MTEAPTAMLTHHARLSSQITALDRELSAISTDRDQAESDRRDALERLHQARAEAERPLLRDIQDAEARRRHVESATAVVEARAEVADAERRIETANRRDAAAMQRRRALAAERADLPVEVSEILILQGQLEQARAHARDLQARLEEVGRRSLPERPDLDAIERQRAAVLADIETGTAKPTALAAIEKQRARLMTEDAKALEERQRADLLARGLTDRLEEARARVAALERDHATLVAGYARVEFEQAARDYHHLAARTFGAHGRLTALAALVRRHDAELSRALVGQHGALLRFACNLTAANELQLIDDPAHRAEAFTALVEELRQVGIQIDAA